MSSSSSISDRLAAAVGPAAAKPAPVHSDLEHSAASYTRSRSTHSCSSPMTSAGSPLARRQPMHLAIRGLDQRLAAGARQHCAVFAAGATRSPTLRRGRIRELHEVCAPGDRRSWAPETRITSIDPFPRADINAICDRVIGFRWSVLHSTRRRAAARRHPVHRQLAPQFHELGRHDVVP